MSPAVEVITSAALRRAGRDGWRDCAVPDPVIARVRPGDYTNAATWSSLNRIDRHRLVALATVARMKQPAPMMCAHSAAVIWGLPIVGALPTRVQVLTDGSAGGSSRWIHRHRHHDLPEPMSVGGVQVTSPARTVVDVARASSLPGGLVIADAALHRGLCTSHDLVDVFASLPAGARGRRAAAQTIRLADDRSESPGESLSRARMFEFGFPQPDLQVPIGAAESPFARGDFGWGDLIGEFDGRRKYRATGDAGDLPSEEVVWREKQREDAIRALGFRVIRWVWADAWKGVGLRDKLLSAGLRPHAQDWQPRPS